MTPHFSAEVDRTVDDPLAQLRPEQTFAASYLLRRQLHPGNAQVVWLAHDEVLGKDVSLHFIPSRVRNDADAMEALRHEVKRNRQLIHPQILRIYDLVEEKECAAIAMDAFEGESLAAIFNERSGGFFEPAQIERWLLSLCRTLEDAHKIQLVHRDFSPANIYLQKSGELLVTRFGISRLICDTLHRLGATLQPESGLAYVSPQQLAGERPAISDDIYSFGVLLHEMLVGEPPFSGSEMIAQIRQKKPASVMERRAELKRNGEEIPVAWQKVIAACLDKSAEQRPKEMFEIAAQLGLGDGENASPAERNAPAANASATAASASAASAASAGSLAAATSPHLRRGEIGSGKPAFQPKKETATAGSAMSKAPATSVGSAKGESIAHPVGAKMSRSRTAERDSVSNTAQGQSGIANSERTPKLGSRKEPEPLFDESAVPDHYPSFEARSSSFPMTGLAAAALLTMIGVYGFFFYSPEKTHGDVIVAESGEMGGPIPSVIDPTADYNAEIGGDRTAGDVPDLFAANNSSLDVAIAAAEEEQEDAEPDPPEKNTGTSTTAADVLNKAAAAAEKTAPPPAPEVVEAPPAAKSQPASRALDSRVAAKAAALEKAKKAAEAAEQAHQEMLKQKVQADEATAQAQQAVEEKTKAAAPMTKAAEEAVAQRKVREEEMRAAEAAAQQAQQIAAEKARLAEDAKKALATAENETKEKVAAQEKADAETTAMRAALEEKRRQAADLAKTMADATTRRDEQLAALKRTEQELAEAEEAARVAAERRRKIEAQIADARANFEKKIAELEEALKKSEAPGNEAIPESAPPVTAPVANPDATAPAENSDAAPPPIPTASVPPKNSAEMLLAKRTDPNKPAGTETEKSDLPPRFENSLGMKFAPVGNILFCIWQTRLSDFEMFARATGLRSTLWKDPGFRQGPDHPVVNVSWREAIAFCKWLTAKEQKEGLLPTNQEYRLPTDLEWSKAVGLPEEKGKTADARDMEILDVYPWGTAWPPPKDAGNYTGEETGSDVAIKGYDDGFAWTSPVGSFAPNNYGLYDMGGNVWQWCMDWWNAEGKTKVLRGGSWYGALKVSLLSSCRVHLAPNSRTDDYGFRCVIAAASGRSSRR